MIYVIMGKSSSGKDTIYHRLLEDETLDLHRVVTYTTRPMRQNEKNGVEYFFTDVGNMLKLEEQGRVIEKRCYNTVHGEWNYFTVDDGKTDIHMGDYLVIGTLESYESIKKYYGENLVYPLYVEVENGERLSRALEREKSQNSPKYTEMCRRFIADEEDFSEEKLNRLEIHERYVNDDIDNCIQLISRTIKAKKQ